MGTVAIIGMVINDLTIIDIAKKARRFDRDRFAGTEWNG